jgi:hypothetical protein
LLDNRWKATHISDHGPLASQIKAREMNPGGYEEETE